ncbi:MAG: Mur ligase family protein, partial [bacterium]|nr:Mur ligase family protein [bacterium]
ILNELTKDYEILIAEIGAYERGKIKQVCEMLQPKIGILTGINEQHLSTFGSLENIIEAKFELIESLPEDGIAFFNARNKYCVELYQKTKIRKFLYGEKATFLGEENILGAMAVAKELGMTEEEISRAIGKIKNKFGGIQIKKGINGLNIIDATYSANPDGVIAHLEYLKTFPGEKVIVMPCLIELGKASAQVHKRIGQKIGEVCDLAIITTKDKFKEIKDGAGDRAVFMEDSKAILEKIKNFTKEGDLVLLESRVPNFLIKQLIL